MTGRLFLLFGISWLAGCAGPRSESEPPAWLVVARAAHQQADRGIAAEKFEPARSALRHALELSGEGSLTIAQQQIVQDLYFRAAEVELLDGQPAAAASLASEGLRRGPAGSVFAANLFIARGQARVVLGQDVSAGRDYHEALKINERLLEQALK